MDTTDALGLTAEGNDIFRAECGAPNLVGTLFGGQLVAQALIAAARTCPDMPLTSAHAYFLAAGAVDRPVHYQVVRLRDSRRFANRQIMATQDGQTIFTLMAQFHTPENGFKHQQVLMPYAPQPESVLPLREFVQQNQGWLDPATIRSFGRETPIEIRPIDPETYFRERRSGSRNFWFRLPDVSLGEEASIAQCLLAYASDYWLSGVIALPHSVPTNGHEIRISSLDHVLWFHRPVPADDWMFFETSSPSASDGLGLAEGRIFDRDGGLVATCAQECLLRRID